MREKIRRVRPDTLVIETKDYLRILSTYGGKVHGTEFVYGGPPDQVHELISVPAWAYEALPLLTGEPALA